MNLATWWLGIAHPRGISSFLASILLWGFLALCVATWPRGGRR